MKDIDIEALFFLFFTSSGIAYWACIIIYILINCIN